MPTGTAGWQVIIPLKHASQAKTRLQLPAVARGELMRAFAADVISACEQTPEVASIVVVADTSWRHHVPADVRFVPDPGRGLNPAILAAIAVLPRHAPLAVLMGDLPCLRAAELSEVLGRPPPLRSVVADDKNIGSTALLVSARQGVRSPGPFTPRFGPDSLSAHHEDGAVDLSATVGPGLRLDVDDQADLRRALRQGLGAHTAAALGAVLGDSI